MAGRVSFYRHTIDIKINRPPAALSTGGFLLSIAIHTGMTIIYCKELAQEQLDHETVEKGTTREYDRYFLCISDGSGGATSPDRPQDALNAVSSTYSVVRGSAYPGDSTSYCKNIKCARQEEDGLSFFVTLHYGQWPYGSPTSSPFDQPAQWGITGRTFQQIVDCDYQGQKVLNSAGDPFLPGLVKDMDRAIITITQNDDFFNPSEEITYANCINSNSYLGLPAYTLKLPFIQMQARWDAQYGWVYNKTWQFEYNAGSNSNGWKDYVLDAGLYELDTTTGKRKPIMVSNSPAQTPQLLDGSGHAAAAGADPQYKTFTCYTPLEFGWSFRGIS
jgi:hypothetical protein